MIKDREVAEPNSCLNQAAADEPIFVLRANDELAPGVVREWAQRYLMAKTARHPHVMTAEQTRKMHEALKLAGWMQDWKQLRETGHGK